MTILSGNCRILGPDSTPFDLALTQACQLSCRRSLGCQINLGMAAWTRARLTAGRPFAKGVQR
ncbi:MULTISPECIES: hypothetical protein [unclassified Xanthobacter]|uniref:hypothetical protein n=1 Tax=unclassified Xanthobacter TaxID=2623496 RepID=UPI001F312682|nr:MULTISPECIES: hypothetical protein [unclassified Xanthobacter]